MNTEQSLPENSDAPDTGDSEDLTPDNSPDTEQDSDVDSGEPDTEEFDAGDDVKLAVPKPVAEKLRAGFMKAQDYTQKTQTLAEERRQLEAQRETLVRQQTEHVEYVQEKARLVALDQQLEAYNKLDWNTLIDQDPQLAQKYQQQQRLLEGERNKAETAITQKEQQIALTRQQENAKLVQDAEAYLKREIPGIDETKLAGIYRYAVGAGMSQDLFGKALTHAPQVAVFINKAMQLDQLLAKQKGKSQQQTQTTAKPALQVGTKASVKKDPANMSDKEFAEFRKRQIAQR